MAEEYERLRQRVESLNACHGWSLASQFNTMFPSLEAQALIERLDEQVGASSPASHLESAPPVGKLLRNLAHWTFAVATASRTARDFRR
jgi:hypothetical protein